MDGKENPKDDSPLDHNDTCLYTYSNNHNYNYKHQHQKSKSFVTSNPRVTQNDNADADKDQYKLYSSSDENIQKTCNSNISTIDTQSINNILDGYEDLDCEKSSDSSSLNARNFKLETDIDIGTGINQHLDPHQEHLLQQKHQQLDKIFITAGKMRHRPTCCSSERLDKKQVLRVNQQTQVRQRPRDPVKEHQQQHQHHISLDAHKVSPFAGDGDLNSLIARSNTNIYENKKIPGRQVMYLQKGEVQKRVDEWLNHSQNLQLNKSNASCSGGSSNKLINSSNKREIYLTRSNSNIEQKRRYCNNESRLLNDKMESRLNDTVSFENLNSEQQLPRREYKAILSNDRINSQKETYRDYSAVRNGLRNHRLHHQDTDNLKVYKINQTDGVSESSGDYFYPHPQLKQQRMSTYHQDIKVTCEKKGYFEEDKEIYSKSKLVSNGIRRVPSASRRPIRCADDPPSKNKARESRRQLITAPVNQHVSNSESVNETTVEKEPINHQTVNKELNKVKKPPPPPRRDFNDRNNREETFKHTLFNNQSGCSSFKPLGKLLTKQLGDCNANDDFDITIGRVHDIRLVTRNTDHDNDQIINNNSSLHCKTVNSDDLLSILTPAAKKSVYKEDYQEEPDRGFANFTKEVHQNSNSSEFTNVGAKSFKRRDNYYCKDNTCREHSVDTENDKVLSTFNKYNKDRLKEVIDEEKSSADKIEIVEKNLTSRSRSSSTNKVTDKILQESYEDRSTLKLDRDRGAIHTKDLESRGTLVADFAENSIFQHKNDDCFQSHLLNAKKSLKVEPIYSKANSDSIHGELFKVKHKTMINNDSSCTPTINSDVYNNLSLLKSSVDNSKGNNDSFERLFNEETNQVKRFNFNSVLSDDYKNLHIREANRLNECKVYNTKEMKERQRLMDMLRKRDYHAVKLVSY